MTMIEPQPSAATEHATGRYEFPYNRTFQAIAAAIAAETSVYAEDVGANVSVKAFQEAFNSFPDARPLNEPQEAVGNPIAWMNREHIEAYAGGRKDGIAWASYAQSEFFSVPVYSAVPQRYAANVEVPTDALINLVNYQEQCDEDGVMVKVSRQALAEVLVYVQMVRPDLNAPPQRSAGTDGDLDFNDPLTSRIMGAARLHTHDHTMAYSITREVLAVIRTEPQGAGK